MLNNIIGPLKLPELLQFDNGTKINTEDEWLNRRREILNMLSEKVYGFPPEDPIAISSMVSEVNKDAYAGKVIEEHMILSAQLENTIFPFPVKFFLPKHVENPMVIVYIAFRDGVPDRYLPIEEVTDEGFAVATFCYNDVAFDGEDNYVGGLAGILKGRGERKENATGKIMMWAWAASRVMDYLMTRNDIDHDNIAVMGHSRLGKTALVAAAYDERFAFCFPNNSGCTGDAITREKEGERVDVITKVFPYWFCPNYRKYAGKEHEMPFDQHFLVAAIAPRFVAAGTAVEDTWADPNSQYLSYVAADEVYKLLGKDGFIHPDRLPKIGDTLHEGTLGFHLRSGRHFHSRYDWIKYMEFMKRHRI